MNVRLLSAQEVADRLQVPRGTLYKWRYKGQGPRSLRIGRHLRYRLDDVEAFEQQQADLSAGRYSQAHGTTCPR